MAQIIALAYGLAFGAVSFFTIGLGCKLGAIVGGLF